MEDKNIFGNLIKITQNNNAIIENEILRESNSLSFITIKEVDKENVSEFVKDLEKFIVKLDDALRNIYRHEIGSNLQKTFENLLTELKMKQQHLIYLSSGFELTSQKIEALKKRIEEHERKLDETEAKKLIVAKRIRDLRGRSCKQRPRRETSVWKRLHPILKKRSHINLGYHHNIGGVVLQLEPVQEETSRDNLSLYVNHDDQVEDDQLDLNDDVE